MQLEKSICRLLLLNFLTQREPTAYSQALVELPNYMTWRGCRVRTSAFAAWRRAAPAR